MLEVAAPTLGALQASEGMMRERDEARRSATLAWQEIEENREILAREWSFKRFVGRSPAVRELEVSVSKASETEFPVLLLGETGTGKSIIARVLHHGSPRAKGPFMTVFCPSLEKGMVVIGENEEFVNEAQREEILKDYVAAKVFWTEMLDRATTE